MLCSLFAGTQSANSAPPKGIAVQTFLYIDFPDNPQCWTVDVSTSSIQYNNICGNTLAVDILVTHPDGTQEDFLIAYGGKLIFFNGTPNVVHIIKEQ
jgi:hypothetical protein